MAKKVFIVMLLAVCLWGVSGSVVLADNALVQCGRQTGTTANPESNSTPYALQCNFASAVEMINTIIGYAIGISMPLAAIAFAYAGWLYLSAGDNPGKVGDAKKIFIDVGIGVAILLSGWLVFTLIATTFLDKSANYGTYLK